MGKYRTALAVILVAAGWGGMARAADKVTVAAQFVGPSISPALLIAREKGFFADEGIDLQTLSIETPGAGIATVMSGNADLVITGPSAGFFNVANNNDLVLVAGDSYQKKGYSPGSIIVSNAAYAAGLRRVEDMAGRKIGIASTGSVGQYILYAVTRLHHVPFESLQFVQLQANSNLSAAIKAGSIDATTGSIAINAPMEKNGDGRIISRTAEEDISVSGNVVFTSRKAIASRREVLVKFMRAYLRGEALYAATFEQGKGASDFARTPEADDLLNILAAAEKSPVDAVIQSLTYVPPDGALDMPGILDQMALWQRMGMADKGIDGAKLSDPSILEAARKH